MTDAAFRNESTRSKLLHHLLDMRNYFHQYTHVGSFYLFSWWYNIYLVDSTTTLNLSFRVWCPEAFKEAAEIPRQTEVELKWSLTQLDSSSRSLSVAVNTYLLEHARFREFFHVLRKRSDNGKTARRKVIATPTKSEKLPIWRVSECHNSILI